MDFVVIGGVAGAAYGSSYPTFDLDVAYGRDPVNLERLARVLTALGAKLRGAPEDVPFQLDAKSLEAGGNFTFATRLGSVDILAYPTGLRRMSACAPVRRSSMSRVTPSGSRRSTT